MKGDRVTAVVFIATALIFWSQTGALQYNCRIFPRLLMIFLILLSILMFAHTFWVKELKGSKITKEDLIYIVTAVFIAFLWVYLITIIGFIIGSILCLTTLTIILDLQTPTPRRILFAISVYTAMVFVFWLIFHGFLLVPLPKGFLI